jgi:DNA invertase Pin-like site-specific DNA recombinase
LSNQTSQQSAAAYIRYASKKQDDALSLEALEQQIRERAQQDGNEIVAVYTDPVESDDRNENLPGTQEMLKDAEEGRFDYIYVHKLNRLSRHLEGALEIVKRLQELGITLKSMEEEFDLEKPLGNFFFNTLVALDEFFSTHQEQDNREVIQHA